MQETSLTEKINPGNHLHLYSDKEMSDDFYQRLRIMENSRHDQDNLKLDEDLKVVTESMLDEDDDEEEEEDEDDDFSFVSAGEDAAAIAAEDAFSNGQIKAVFPLFDQSLLYGDESSDSSLPMRPPVKNVFVETKEVGGQAGTSSADEIAGPFCEWSSRKAAEASSPEVCKKSNSTGFSKLWRLKELTARSNSDGRDAFVFLHSSHAPPAAKQPAVAEKKEQAVKVKKSGKSKKAAVSAHEVYLRSKAKEDDHRRRSYLPYRPELMGFFTNVNGGLTKNVHPF